MYYQAEDADEFLTIICNSITTAIGFLLYHDFLQRDLSVTALLRPVIHSIPANLSVQTRDKQQTFSSVSGIRMSIIVTLNIREENDLVLIFKTQICSTFTFLKLKSASHCHLFIIATFFRIKFESSVCGSLLTVKKCLPHVATEVNQQRFAQHVMNSVLVRQ